MQALYEDKRVVCENTALARQLYEKSRYGTLLADGRVELSLLEALFLLESKKVQVVTSRAQLSFEELWRRASRIDKRVSTRYPVFRDFRKKGYVVKTALKFGADFRVYERGTLPGQAHAKWVVFAVRESESFTWQEFSAKNRVAHSTKKKLLLAVVDDELDVSYWEVGWVKP